MNQELTARLEYSEQDANAIFSRMLGRKYEMPKGFVDVKYAKPDVVAGLQYLCGDEELAQISVECYDAEKRAGFVEEAAAKVKEITQSQSLETKVRKSKIGGIKSFCYGLTSQFIIPTLFYKAGDVKGWPLLIGTVIGVSGSIIGYKSLIYTNSKLIPYVLGTQIITNIASGIYETVRAKRKRKEEEDKEKEQIRMSQMNEEEERKFISEKIDEWAEEFRNGVDRKIPKNVRGLRELCYKTNSCQECEFSLCEYFRGNSDKKYELTEEELENMNEKIKRGEISHAERAHLMYVAARNLSIFKKIEKPRKTKT